LLRNNRFDVEVPFVMWSFDSTTEENNEQGTVRLLEFVDFMNQDIDANVRRIEWWTDRATLSPDARVVEHVAGAYVMHLGTWYRATQSNAEAAPSENPELWEALPPPADDVRVREGSPYADYGVGR
jgi:hypothetical protein